MACQSENFDFAALPILDEGILLEGLRQRYNEDYIYVSHNAVMCKLHYKSLCLPQYSEL